MTHPERSSLVFDVRAGERLELSGAATIELVHKSGQLCRLFVTAPRDVAVFLEKKPSPQACHSRTKDDTFAG
jgi:hypothetical protein